MAIDECVSMPLRSSALFLFLVACTAPVEIDRREFASGSNLSVDRSLVVTDPRILADFRFTRVLDQLVIQANSQEGRDVVFQKWWDVQNDDANGLFADVRHCQDTVNDFPFACPRQEGSQAKLSALEDNGPDSYKPLALFNRFDVRNPEGKDCGEHRVVFGKVPTLEQQIFDRNLIIFEARVENPDPSQGAKGCMPIAKFWASLTEEADFDQRRQKLEEFYFVGLALEGGARMKPVLHIDNFAADTGQIRTNQFMFQREYLDSKVKKQPWQLREFKIRKTDDGLVFDIVTVKENAFAALMRDELSGLSPEVRAKAKTFKSDFINAAQLLVAAITIDQIVFKPSDRFNTAQSTIPLNPAVDNDSNYETELDPDGAFAQQLQTTLGRNSSLTPVHIARRAVATTCAGCHQLSNNADLGNGLEWPASLQFVHVSDLDTEPCIDDNDGGDLQCAILSPALRDSFLPSRKALLETFLNEPDADIGTRRGN
jgi:hypothetical protein